MPISMAKRKETGTAHRVQIKMKRRSDWKRTAKKSQMVAHRATSATRPNWLYLPRFSCELSFDNFFLPSVVTAAAAVAFFSCFHFGLITFVCMSCSRRIRFSAQRTCIVHEWNGAASQPASITPHRGEMLLSVRDYAFLAASSLAQCTSIDHVFDVFLALSINI